MDLLNTLIEIKKVKDMIILVDRNDNIIGTTSVMAAHEKGHLHRAFSIFIFNSAGELLMQKRSSNKLHSTGLWSNTCCGHPLPGENTSHAARRWLKEEFSLSLDLDYLFKFHYKADFNNVVTENEIMHVFCCISDEVPQVNPSEVSEYKYMSMEAIGEDIQVNPENYTVWFRLLVDHFLPVESSLGASMEK